MTDEQKDPTRPAPAKPTPVRPASARPTPVRPPPADPAKERAYQRTPNEMEDSDSSDNIVLIDASNVAHSTEGDAARLENILLVRDRLIEQGYEPIVVADAALRHQIDDGGAYERLVDEGTVRQAPAGTDADYFLLSFARELDAPIVSNDRFRDRLKSFPEVQDRVIRYMVVAGEVVFERRTRKRADE